MMHSHPKGCRCSACRPACAPGVLLPRIICSGRDWVRCQSTCLCVEGIDPCAPMPFSLVEVTAGQPLISREGNCCLLTVPLQCRITDSKGCVHMGKAQTVITVRLQHNCPESEWWRYQCLANVCVRQVCRPPCSQDHHFQTQLEILAEVWLVKWEAVNGYSPNKEVCPNLPLYPQPCCWERQ